MDDLIELIATASGFEMFEEIECALGDSATRLEHAEIIFETVAKRCLSDPSFRQDILDLNILSTILTVLERRAALFPDNITAIAGNDVSVKNLFGEFGVVAEFRQQLERVIDGKDHSGDFIRALVCLLTGSDTNRKEFFGDKHLLEKIVNSLSQTDGNRGLLDVLVVLFSGDDPTTVFMRDSLIQYVGGFEDFCSKVLRPIRDETPIAVMSILPSLCNSHTHCASLIEKGWLRWAMTKVNGGSDPSCIRACAKFFRSLSFDEDSKDTALKQLEKNGILQTLLAVSVEDAVVSAHTFGLLANLCLRNASLAGSLLEKYLMLGELIERVVSQSPTFRSINELTQCMQFLRSLAKGSTAQTFLSGLAPKFSDRKINDKTICRIRDEIFIGG